jgi:HlyD family secretion protein
MRYKFLVAMTAFLVFGCTDSRGENFAGSGTLEALEIELSALLAGRVISVGPHEGDMVKDGDTVVTLDTEALELQRTQLEKGFQELELGIKQAEQGVEQARIARDTLEKNYKRIQNLREKNVATQSQYDEIKAQYEAAQARLRGAELAAQSLVAKRETLEAQLNVLNRQIKEGVIKSPISGEVLERFVEPGEVVRPGQSILTVADLSLIKLKIYLSEPDMGKIRIRDKMKLKVDAFPGRNFEGTVVWISPRAEFTPKNVETRDARAELVYAVKLEIENPDRDLKIGMPADAFF